MVKNQTTLLQILPRALPTASHDSDNEMEIDPQVQVEYNCACCGNVTVDKNANENKERNDHCGGVG